MRAMKATPEPCHPERTSVREGPAFVPPLKGLTSLIQRLPSTPLRCVLGCHAGRPPGSELQRTHSIAESRSTTLQELCAAPEGARVLISHPPSTPAKRWPPCWAKLCRAYGAGVVAQNAKPSNSTIVSCLQCCFESNGSSSFHWHCSDWKLTTDNWPLTTAAAKPQRAANKPPIG